MPKVIEVRGYGCFTVEAPRSADELPLLVPAPPHAIQEERDGENVPVVIPHAPAPAVVEDCPVTISPDGTAVSIAGHEVPAPRGVGLRALTALIQAFPGGLTRAALNTAANAADARAALRELTSRDPIWDAALRTPRQGKDYRDRNATYRIAGRADLDWALRLAGWLPEEEARTLGERQADARTLAEVIGEALPGLPEPTPTNR